MAPRKEIELAWAAGFFDGEGCTSGGACKGNHQIYMAVSQKDKLPLIKFQQIVGCGHLYRRIQKKNSFRRKASYIWVWRINDFRLIEKLFEDLKPYLSQAKINQASKVINDVKRVRNKLKKERGNLRLKRLTRFIHM
jgi:hypothetical protein